MSDTTNTTTELERKIKELDDVTRVLTNGLKLVTNSTIKVSDILPIQEFVGFLAGMQRNIAQQRTTLEAALPKLEVIQEEAKV
jgi:hypothetical protein